MICLNSNIVRYPDYIGMTSKITSQFFRHNLKSLGIPIYRNGDPDLSGNSNIVRYKLAL
ncbi:MAG: hypothetical protein JW866_02915 [Ignavibacteriales bacterium]|nr:hypothetical protein [Ignavibacteriales bacterium]